ncbi:ABC transporter substrate-binding protein [Mycetocola spongiae]|uniref:ABC transporter substrate-binding protein n=1 Tax=Mycetocola spongiae TaxID=2859226 RepID=UPI001CF5D981|nr:extracellular solute-binding protein [Mycetocola spongiae]
MKLHRTVAVATMAVVSLSLAACSAGGTPAQSEGPVEIKFQSFSDQPAAIAATEEIVAAWNKDHADSQIKLIQAPSDSLDDKLTTQFAGEVAPDIIHYEIQGIAPFARDGYIADLSSLLSQKTLDDIEPGVLDSVTLDGKIVGAPTELQTYVVFANKGLLESAGVSIPTGDSMSWDTFAEIAKASTTPEVHGAAWGLKSPTAAFLSLGLGFDGTFFGTGKDVSLTVGEKEMEVPNRVRAMIDAGSLDPIGVTQSSSDVLATFYGGKAAMTVQGSYQIANVAADAPADMDWIVLPPLEGSAGIAQAATPQTLSINIDSAVQKQAAEFIDYFMQTDNLVKMNTADGLIPTTTSARAAIAEQNAGVNGWDAILASAAGLKGPTFLGADGYVRWKDTVATPGFQKFLGKEIDGARLATDLEAGWAQVNK